MNYYKTSIDAFKDVSDKVNQVTRNIFKTIAKVFK